VGFAWKVLIKNVEDAHAVLEMMESDPLYWQQALDERAAPGNDYGFERMFERQVDALAQAGDVVIGLTTSGNSDNVVRGLRAARRRDARTVALLGRTTGRVGRVVDLAIRVPATSVPVVQEIHECFLHLVCQSVDRRLTSRTAPSRTQTRRKGRG
jgi:DNA-binding MurR/RpiR family transcriptional regulator